MGLLSRILGQGGEITESSGLEAFLRVGGSNESHAGMSVTPDVAMRCTAVFACVRILAETVAQLPLILYRRGSDGRSKDRATDHPLYTLLHDRPNRWQTSFEFREMVQGHQGLRGNGYALKVPNARGELVELIPLNPARMTPEQFPDRSVVYRYAAGDGEPATMFSQREIMHLRGISSDGVVGLSPLAYGREAIGLALATERFGASLFKSGALMRGILTHPTTFKDTKVRDRVRDSWDSATSGANAHKTAVLEDGLAWQQVSMSAEDAQFILTRKLQIAEIARLYRMPLHKLGELDKATFSNIEHQSVEFVTDTMLPVLCRWEQVISRDLLTPADLRAGYFAEFLVDGLLRGDAKSRAEGLQIQRRNGVLNANEWRALENMNPRTDPGGDEYIVESNMAEQTGAPAAE